MGAVSGISRKLGCSLAGLVIGATYALAASPLDQARELVARTVATSTEEERTDLGVMKEKIRSDLRRFLIKRTSRHPLIMPVILEV